MLSCLAGVRSLAGGALAWLRANDFSARQVVVCVFCGSPKTETDRIIAWLFDSQKAPAAISKASGDSLAIH